MDKQKDRQGKIDRFTQTSFIEIDSTRQRRSRRLVCMVLGTTTAAGTKHRHLGQNDRRSRNLNFSNRSESVNGHGISGPSGFGRVCRSRLQGQARWMTQTAAVSSWTRRNSCRDMWLGRLRVGGPLESMGLVGSSACTRVQGEYLWDSDMADSDCGVAAGRAGRRRRGINCILMAPQVINCILMACRSLALQPLHCWNILNRIRQYSLSED